MDTLLLPNGCISINASAAESQKVSGVTHISDVVILDIILKEPFGLNRLREPEVGVGGIHFKA